MKANQKIVLSALVAGMVTLTGCGGGGGGSAALPVNSDPQPISGACTTVGSVTATGTTIGGKEEVVLQGCLDSTLGSALTLDASKIYAINGEVSVKGATLTIPAGTTLYGRTGQSYLAIDQGAKIEATGTQANPIVFTSAADVAGTAGANDQGKWGGVSIFGTAHSNKGVETYEAGDHQFACDDNTVACNNADNSGTLEYVVIKYSGFEVETDKELNGLSLGGVGSGTTIDHVAVIGSLDDGIEVWGGTVNMTNLYLYNNADDSLDWDHGWTGSATNLYIEQNLVDSDGSRGFETDNNGGSVLKEQATPISNPTIDQFTIVTSALGGQGIVHREGTAGQLSNGIIITNNAARANVEVRSTTTLTQGLAYSGDMVLSQAADIHYAGKADNGTDVFGTTTAAQVQAIVEGATVTLDNTGETLANLKAATPTAGADVTSMPAWTN